MRARKLLLQRWGARSKDEDFVSQCQGMKNRFRGRGQFVSSKEAAAKFIEGHIPKDIHEGGWINAKYACAALAFFSFFEIEHDGKAAIGNWLSTRLFTMSPEEKLDAGIALLQADQSRYRDSVRNSCIIPLSQNASALSPHNLGSLVKLMQRCGSDLSNTIWEDIGRAVSKIPMDEVPAITWIRIFSGFSRHIPEAEITKRIMETLIQALEARQLQPFDYSTFLASVARMHAHSPLDVKIFKILAVHAAEYGPHLNCRDLGTTLSNIMRIRSGFKTTEIQYLFEIDDAIQTVLYSLKSLPMKYMDANDSEAWSSETDIVALIFAFESSGSRFDELFDAFNIYVHNRVATIEGRNLALSLGILRRSKHLDDALAKSLSDRVAEVIDDFQLTELSHVVFTYLAVRGEQPSWIDRARTRMASLLQESTPSHARLNIRVSFPGESALVSNVDLSTISFRQMFDVLKAPNVTKDLHDDVREAFKKTLQEIVAPNSAEIEVIMEVGTTDFCGLGSTAKEVASKILSQNQWPLDMVALSCLCSPSEQAEHPDKALKIATVTCNTTNRFVACCGTLLQHFPKNENVREWAIKGANRILELNAQIQVYITMFKIFNEHKIELGNTWYQTWVFGPLSSQCKTLGVTQLGFFLEQIRIATPDPHAYREAVTFMLALATEAAKSPEQLAPIFITVAKIGGIPLSGEGTSKILEKVTTLSVDERALLEKTEKSEQVPFTGAEPEAPQIVQWSPPREGGPGSGRGMGGNGRGGGSRERGQQRDRNDNSRSRDFPPVQHQTVVRPNAGAGGSRFAKKAEDIADGSATPSAVIDEGFEMEETSQFELKLPEEEPVEKNQEVDVREEISEKQKIDDDVENKEEAPKEVEETPKKVEETPKKVEETPKKVEETPKKVEETP
eukprot:Tbor_TRINITY_DN5679_c1_g3::TRINITY_DN5679_c1_g3_i1::g.8736::m.8736